MPTTYLLPCECGAKVPIEVGQAGQSISCACGQVLVVPTMREIARLEQAEQNRTAQTVRRWSPLQGVVFAGGLITTIVALLAATYFGMVWSSVPANAPKDTFDLEVWSQEYLQNAPPDELHNLWGTIEKEGLGTWTPPPSVLYREFASVFLQRTWIALAIAALGVAATVGSFYLKSPASTLD